MSILTREVNGASIPSLISEQVTLSDYENALGANLQYVSAGNTKAYLSTLQGLSTIASVTQVWNPTRQNQKFMLGQIEIPVYELNSYYSVDYKTLEVTDRTLSAVNAGVSTMQIMRDLCRQAMAQRIRVLTLFGAGAGEGILEGASNFTIGSDAQSKTKVTEMDPVFFAQRLAQMIADVVTNVKNTDSKISVLTSNRIYNFMAKTIIRSTEYLSTGSTVSILDFVKQVAQSHGRECLIGFDDMLEARVAQKDIIFVNAPGIVPQNGEGITKDLNAVGYNANTLNANTIIDTGSAGVYEKVNPEMNNVISGNFYATATCGVTVRSQSALKAEVEY